MDIADLSRRAFLGTGTAMGLGAMLAPAAEAKPYDPMPAKWDEEVDVLIVGSGDWVHNLRAAFRGHGGERHDWADRFNETVKDLIARGDHAPLIDWMSLGQDARLSIPTDEHYLPLLYVLGAQGQDDEVRFFNDAIELGAISMTGVVVGKAA